MSDDIKWDLEADVVVLGSGGGAALTAAIAAHDFGAKDVVILERSGMVGGTTAMSGQPWGERTPRSQIVFIGNQGGVDGSWLKQQLTTN